MSGNPNILLSFSLQSESVVQVLDTVCYKIHTLSALKMIKFLKTITLLAKYVLKPFSTKSYYFINLFD